MAARPRASAEAAERSYQFTADAGVTMLNGRVRFEREHGTPGRRYRFATTDAELAARLRGVTAHGITEVTENDGD